MSHESTFVKASLRILGPEKKEKLLGISFCTTFKDKFWKLNNY